MSRGREYLAQALQAFRQTAEERGYLAAWRVWSDYCRKAPDPETEMLLAEHGESVAMTCFIHGVRPDEMF